MNNMPAEQPRKEATVVEDDAAGRDREEKTPNEQAYRPKELLNLEDGNHIPLVVEKNDGNIL